MQRNVPRDIAELLMNQIPHPAIMMNRSGEILASNELFGSEIETCDTMELFSSKSLARMIQDSLKDPAYSKKITLHNRENEWINYSLNIDKGTFESEALFFGHLKKQPASLKMPLQEEKVSTFIQSLPDAIFYLDLKGNIIERNPTAEKLTAHSDIHHEKQVSLRFYLHEEDREKHDSLLKQVLTGEPRHILLRLIDRHGILHNLDFSYIPVSEQGEVGGIYAIGQDKTRGMVIENELKEVKGLLEAYFQNSSESICLLDEEGNILKANTAFEKMFGWKKDEVAGYTLKMLCKCSHEINELIKRVKKKETIIGHEFTTYDKWNNAIHVSLTINPMITKSETVIGMTAVLRDITKQKKTEDLLKKSEQLSLIGQLAAGVAHEIRNPLTTLKGFMQLLREDVLQKVYYEVILDELHRIELITGEFLSLAKPHAVNFKVCSFNKLVFDVTEFINIECLKNNVILHVNVNEFMEVNCDKHQLKQVILNVIKNALEAMPSGGELTIHLDRRDTMAVLSIHDSGVGIPSHRLKHLGEPFYSTKEKGTGLGLMISHKIMKEHLGSFIIESVEGVGTTVKIELPIVMKK